MHHFLEMKTLDFCSLLYEHKRFYPIDRMSYNTNLGRIRQLCYAFDSNSIVQFADDTRLISNSDEPVYRVEVQNLEN